MGLFRSIAEHFGWVKPLVPPVAGETWIEKEGAYGPPDRIIITSVGSQGVRFRHVLKEETGPNSPPQSPRGTGLAPHWFFHETYRKE